MRKQKILVQLLVNAPKLEKHPMDIPFLGLLTDALNNSEKKAPHKPQLLPAVPISKKKAEKWGWVTAHTRPEPARQSSEHRKMKLLLLRNHA